MPRIQRQPPPYMQITDSFRSLIIDGVLREGDKLPTVAEVAREWSVAHATAARAISQLQVEGLITSSPSRGSVVASQGSKASSPQDRISRSRRTGTTEANGEHHLVTAAEIVAAPPYVAELFDMEHAGRVVRREWTTVEDKQQRALTVTWHPAELVEGVPELLDKESSRVGPLLSRIESVTGKATRARDFYHARGADAREASALGLPIGAAVLAMTWLVWVSTEDGEDRLIEYGESVIPPRHTVSYPYEITVDGE